MNSSQAKKSDEPQQRAVWTQVPAPEIPNSDRQAGQHKNYNESRYGHIRKKFEHFDIGKLIIRAMNKLLYTGARHFIEYLINKKTGDQILQRAQ